MFNILYILILQCICPDLHWASKGHFAIITHRPTSHPKHNGLLQGENQGQGKPPSKQCTGSAAHWASVGPRESEREAEPAVAMEGLCVWHFCAFQTTGPLDTNWLFISDMHSAEHHPRIQARGESCSLALTETWDAPANAANLTQILLTSRRNVNSAFLFFLFFFALEAFRHEPLYEMQCHSTATFPKNEPGHVFPALRSPQGLPTPAQSRLWGEAHARRKR